MLKFHEHLSEPPDHPLYKKSNIKMKEISQQKQFWVAPTVNSFTDDRISLIVLRVVSVNTVHR